MNLCTELPKAAEGDRGHLFAVCDLMTTLAEQSRHEGILALEEWLEYDEASDDTCRIRYPECEKSPLTENESYLFALLLRMIIDGCDCDTVRDVARIAVVMTESNKDPEEWRAIIGNKHRKQELATRFKDNDSPLKIAIVVDMWLTGFDVPSLATMYVYKPMESYNLKQAMNDYTVRDRKNYGEMDVAKRAFPKFQKKLEICRNLFFGYDYTPFYEGSDLQRGMTISGAVNFIVAPNKENEKQAFIKEALMLKQSLSLCSSMVKEHMRLEAAFFESVRVLVMRLLYNPSGKKFSLK